MDADMLSFFTLVALGYLGGDLVLGGPTSANKKNEKVMHRREQRGIK
jgi:hypothetical protein